MELRVLRVSTFRLQVWGVELSLLFLLSGFGVCWGGLLFGAWGLGLLGASAQTLWACVFVVVGYPESEGGLWCLGFGFSVFRRIVWSEFKTIGVSGG